MPFQNFARPHVENHCFEAFFLVSHREAILVTCNGACDSTVKITAICFLKAINRPYKDFASRENMFSDQTSRIFPYFILHAAIYFDSNDLCICMLTLFCLQDTLSLCKSTNMCNLHKSKVIISSVYPPYSQDNVESFKFRTTISQYCCLI